MGDKNLHLHLRPAGGVGDEEDISLDIRLPRSLGEGAELLEDGVLRLGTKGPLVDIEY